MRKPHVVILGAGYGGLMTTKYLQSMLGESHANITLINKNDYHYQATWLHEAAAGTIHHDAARIMIKNVINTNKVKFLIDTVKEIKHDERKVKLKDTEIDYDILVIGLGFEGATFGIPGLKEHAFMIGNLDSSRLIREHLAYNFALYNNEKEKKQSRLNIVVGGGGFTGVEFLGELANRIPELCDEYDINKARVRIINLEGGPTILPDFDKQLIEYAMNSLEARGIEIITGARLKECQEDRVIYEKDGKEMDIPSLTTIWAAGVRANSIVENSGFQTVHGKIAVQQDMRSPEYENVFVVGDCAMIMNPKSGRPYPPTAQIAIQQSKTVAKNIKKLVKGEEDFEHFQPNIQGTLVSLGFDDAMGTIMNGHQLYGWKAIVMKKLIENRYLMKLGGMGLVLKKGKFNVFY